MEEQRYKKAKAWIGKDLTIHVNGGDRKIKDTEELVGSQWDRFVGMKFLERIPMGAPKKAAAPAAVVAKPSAGESMTRSNVSQAAEAVTGSKGKGKGGKKGQDKEVVAEETKPEVVVESETKSSETASVEAGSESTESDPPAPPASQES